MIGGSFLREKGPLVTPHAKVVDPRAEGSLVLKIPELIAIGQIDVVSFHYNNLDADPWSFCILHQNPKRIFRGCHFRWLEGNCMLTDVPMYVNKIKNWAGRINLRYQPDEKFDFLLNIHGGMNRGDSRQFQQMPAQQSDTSAFVDFASGDFNDYIDFDVRCIAGTAICSNEATPGNPARGGEWLETVQGPESGDPFAGDYNYVEPEELNLYGGYLSGDIQLAEGLLFKTITGYEANARNIRSDLDASPFVSLQPTLTNSSWQLTQDLKVIWNEREDLVVEVVLHRRDRRGGRGRRRRRRRRGKDHLFWWQRLALRDLAAAEDDEADDERVDEGGD